MIFIVVQPEHLLWACMCPGLTEEPRLRTASRTRWVLSVGWSHSITRRRSSPVVLTPGSDPFLCLKAHLFIKNHSEHEASTASNCFISSLIKTSRKTAIAPYRPTGALRSVDQNPSMVPGTRFRPSGDRTFQAAEAIVLGGTCSGLSWFWTCQAAEKEL